VAVGVEEGGDGAADREGDAFGGREGDVAGVVGGWAVEDGEGAVSVGVGATLR
jgi:hypothetical protein